MIHKTVIVTDSGSVYTFPTDNDNDFLGKARNPLKAVPRLTFGP